MKNDAKGATLQGIKKREKSQFLCQKHTSVKMAWGSGFAKLNLLRFQNKAKLNQIYIYILLYSLLITKKKTFKYAALLISMSDDRYIKLFYLKFYPKYIIN